MTEGYRCYPRQGLPTLRPMIVHGRVELTMFPKVQYNRTANGHVSYNECQT